MRKIFCLSILTLLSAIFLTACDIRTSPYGLNPEVANNGNIKKETVSTSNRDDSEDNNEFHSGAESVLYETSNYSSKTSSSKNKVLKLSDMEWEKMNIFFSDFFEAFLHDYDEKTSSDMLISFAQNHNRINYPKRLTYTDDRSGEILDEVHVIDTIQRFFGKTIAMKSTAYSEYKNKKFYIQFGDGEDLDLTRFAQATVCTEKNDGSIYVMLEEYLFDESSGYEELDFLSQIYKSKKDWRKSIARHCSATGRKYTATVKRVSLNGRDTYQLIELKKS